MKEMRECIIAAAATATRLREVMQEIWIDSNMILHSFRAYKLLLCGKEGLFTQLRVLADLRLSFQRADTVVDE